MVAISRLRLKGGGVLVMGISDGNYINVNGCNMILYLIYSQYDLSHLRHPDHLDMGIHAAISHHK